MGNVLCCKTAEDQEHQHMENKTISYVFEPDAYLRLQLRTLDIKFYQREDATSEYLTDNGFSVLVEAMNTTLLKYLGGDLSSIE